MRLDKFLAHMGFGTRKEVKILVKSKAIQINEVVVKDSSMHVNELSDQVSVYGEVVEYREFIYLMMNKPAGVVSATEDSRDQTVIDLLDEDVRHFAPYPVGRLDKDTVGLLVLTNDGALTHRLLSPNKDVPKVYYAKIEGIVTESDIQLFKEGVTLDDGYHTKPGLLSILSSGPVSEIELSITEGKFHQVKRMFEAVEKKVIYLKRLSMGALMLDESIQEGDYRELTEVEFMQLQQKNDLA
ncbi:ribosomal small subunit pseudouridine synthase A [Psychrobacillus insolitus]|uniref:Pseudouridine synthase n=1 Tax=Psychrobacillus insolitus TaxID=1461 RepID=A0A2W7MIB7_9BACI|nr:pseudouridine synthase [Psychrobacillus insolitus]PZX06907.1 ribosomal small subunit pseudouridine synthase A [Psychrobacillus insolitus]